MLRLVESDSRQTTIEMAKTLCCDQSTISRHLASLGKVRKLGCWVPHKMTEQNRNQRINICSYFLNLSRTTSWLNSIITGDEKWVMYVNVTREYQFVDRNALLEPEPKPPLMQKKVMLSV